MPRRTVLNFCPNGDTQAKSREGQAPAELINRINEASAERINHINREGEAPAEPEALGLRPVSPNKPARLLVGCLLFIFSALPSMLFAQEEMLEQAIEAYSTAIETKQRDRSLDMFARAEQLFSQVIDEQRAEGREPNSDLLTNLGNASLQAQHIGAAIAAYRQALIADPNHAQASQNLAFARSTLPDWAQRSSTEALVDTLFFWRSLIASRQIAGLSALFFLIAATLIAVSIVFKSGLWRNLALIPLAIWLVLGLSFVLESRHDEPDAVVIVDDAILFSADSENSPPRLAEPLPDGTEVSVLQTRDRWSEVRISGRTGWVRSSTLVRLSE